MSINVRVNAVSTEEQIDELCLSVGWTEFRQFTKSLAGYAITTSAWTDDGRLVGWTSVVSDNLMHAFLLDVMVNRDFQRKGIGRQLVQRVIEAMCERGVTMFHVDSAPHNAGFYANAGLTSAQAGGWRPIELASRDRLSPCSYRRQRRQAGV